MAACHSKRMCHARLQLGPTSVKTRCCSLTEEGTLQQRWLLLDIMIIYTGDRTHKRESNHQRVDTYCTVILTDRFDFESNDKCQSDDYNNWYCKSVLRFLLVLIKTQNDPI